ncbi:MAG: DNA adenine methylase [Salinispira sp.]
MSQYTHNLQVRTEMPFEHVGDSILHGIGIKKKPFIVKPRTVKPFIKWVGGKGAIAPVITKKLPNKISNYYELFTGGGALFFYLHHITENAILSDSNSALMTVYQVIKSDVENLIDELHQHQKNHNKEYFYNIRRKHNLTDSIEIAARFIYLNKTCYNGLYRVNRKGEFNVPMGSYIKPIICNENNLRLCSKALQNVTIRSSSFEDIDIVSGSVIYCDPPYDCAYNNYQVEQFSNRMQELLMHKAIEWYKNGCKVVISNSDTKFIRELYARKIFTIHEIIAPRSVSCKNEGRGKTRELLIIANG